METKLFTKQISAVLLGAVVFGCCAKPDLPGTGTATTQPYWEPKQISAAEFIECYSIAGKNEVRTTESGRYRYQYRGLRDGKAYLKVTLLGPAGTWAVPDVFVAVKDLDPKLRSSLPVEGVGFLDNEAKK